MRWLMVLICGFLALGTPAWAAEGKVLKVLPQFLDTNGLSSVSPSLYDRDSYQAFLRRNPGKRSALRFAVEWKAKAPKTQTLKMRVEMRGAIRDNGPTQDTLEESVKQRGWFSHWAYLKLTEAKYQKLGEITAWRVTLWDGDKLLSEQKSFLW